MIHVTLVKPNAMKKLYGRNIVAQLKVQNHRNIFEATSTVVLHVLLFQMLQKVPRPERTWKQHILLGGILILTNKVAKQLY